jgi:alkylation response protein AidB-like acyl-CoA dehydrogenase
MTDVQNHGAQDRGAQDRRTAPGGTPTGPPTAADVEGLLATVREHADQVERDRRLPDALVDALRRSGINRMLVPRALGGWQRPVAELADVVEQIAAVDASTAWCTVIGAGSNVFAGYLPEAGARHVFADPDQPTATMFAPTGRLTGSGPTRRLTGRWPFTSNCLHSTWIGVCAIVDGPDGPEPAPRLVFAPATAFRVDDTWDSAGLRGTGSHDVVADDVPVELDWSCLFTDVPWPEGTLWRVPIHTALVPLLVSVHLGIARGALDEIARQAREGRDARRGQIADDPLALAEFGQADTRLRAARAALREGLAAAHEAAERRGPVDHQLRARIFLAALAASDVSVEVTSTAHQLAGGAAAYHGNPLLRKLQDVQAARQHQLFSHKHLPALASALAGLPVTYPPFLP